MATNIDIELTELRAEDSATLLRWINDRSEVIWNAAYRPVHEADHITWFEAARQRQDAAIFAIRANGGRLVGTCQLHSISTVHRSAELQIRIGMAEARGQGIGGEALRRLVAIGYDDLNLNRIYLHVFSDNDRAVAAYERLGFVREGLARQAVFVDGAYKDVVLMGLLKSEFHT